MARNTTNVTNMARNVAEMLDGNVAPAKTPCGATKGDGQRTSERGAADAFRFAVASGTVTRAEMIEGLVTTFGPKAKWSALNLLSLAKRGALTGCGVVVEGKDGVLRLAKAAR